MVSSPVCTCNATACTCAAATSHKDHVKMMKLMQFLMGLNDEYTTVRSNILLRDTVLDVKEAYAIISREESHKGISADKIVKTQANAFVTQANNTFNKARNNSGNFSSNNNNRNQNQTLKCKKCNKLGHTIERCFEIISYPPSSKRRVNGNQNNMNFRNISYSNNSTTHKDESSSSASSSAPAVLTNDQLMKLLSLINENATPVDANANMAGNFVNCNIPFNSNFKRFFNSHINDKAKNQSQGWIIDSGANHHMTVSEKGMSDIVDISKLKLTVGHPNGTQAKVVKIGNLKISNNVILYDVLVVPEYCVSLLLVHKLSKDSKLTISFDENKCFIQDLKAMTTVGTGSQSGGLYLFDDHDLNVVGLSCNVCVHFVSSQLWQARLGHPSVQVLKVLKQKLNLKDIQENCPCDICHKAKQVREPFPLSDHKSQELGDLIHLDLWGPFKIQSRDGYKYFLTIVDDFSRGVCIYLLKSKDETFDNIVSFVNLIQNQFNKKVKVLRSDNGTEFVNGKMINFVKTKGIIHQTSCAYTPQQNGVVERKHRHLLNVARALMFQGGLPLNMWKNKFSSRYVKCVLIGFGSVQKGYKLLSLENRSVIFPRDVNQNTKSPNDEERATSDGDGNGNRYSSSDNNHGHKSYSGPNIEVGDNSNTSSHDSSPISDSRTSATPVNDHLSPESNVFQNPFNSPNTSQQSLRKSTREHVFSKKFDDFVVEGKVKYGIKRVVNYSLLSQENFCFISNLNKSVEPKSFFEA
ncbi:uncharacterized protein [Rutidosis leptorrhynchoides]|uniref:uncharacterized protein n=1 Tax=Rutidosis leptorrhynchoides TaxID=125765 RepID=UPI003A98D4EF